MVESFARLVVFEAAGGFIYYLNRFVRVLKVTATAGIAETNYASQHFGQPFVGGLVDVLVWVFFHGYIVLVVGGRCRSRTACCLPLSACAALRVSPMSSMVPHAVLTDGGGWVNLKSFSFLQCDFSYVAGSFPAFLQLLPTLAGVG